MTRWQCPKCKTGSRGHGFDRKCPSGYVWCHGFRCRCEAAGIEDPSVEAKDHGRSEKNPCRSAACGHCGWEGCYPLPPFDIETLRGWAAEAWAAGWRPPEGWHPSGLDVIMSKIEEEPAPPSPIVPPKKKRGRPKKVLDSIR